MRGVYWIEQLHNTPRSNCICVSVFFKSTDGITSFIRNNQIPCFSPHELIDLKLYAFGLALRALLVRAISLM